MNALQNLVAQTKLRLERARARYGWFDVVFRVFKRFSETDGGTHCAALTYYTFLSIFPLLLFAASALGYVTLGNTKLQTDIFNSAVDQFPMLKDAFTPEGFKFINERRQELAIVGVILALYSGSGAVVALGHALNKVIRVDDEGNFFQKRLASIKWLGILGAGAVVSVGLSSLAQFSGKIFESLQPVGDVVLSILFHVLGVAAGIGIFATAFRFLPHKEQSWAEVLPGAVVAGLAFELLKTVGKVVLASGAEGRNATFGTFAAAAGLLVTFHLVSQATLLSAEVNAVLAERRLTREPAYGDQGGNREQ